MNFLVIFAYIMASLLFVIGIQRMRKIPTARSGNILSSGGMLLAILAALLEKQVLSWSFVILGLVLGALIGIFIAYRTPFTAMPQMVGLLNGFGGLASLLVAFIGGLAINKIGWEAYCRLPNALNQEFSPIAARVFYSYVLFGTLVVGGVTFSGSLVAFWKLSERKIPKILSLQRFLLFFCEAILLLSVFAFSLLWEPSCFLLLLVSLLSCCFGILITWPIGGGDMPVIIALLNSLSGLAAALAGLVVLNAVLIVGGCLVGASGFILMVIMCKAMNRSLRNILFSGLGVKPQLNVGGKLAEPKTMTLEEAYFVLENAKKVVFIPGYGLAVAQAQHLVKELGNALEQNGTEVFFAIHPVAGRMPGHMNVLLSEADVSYDQLLELEAANRQLRSTDVAIVIGANDTVNTGALEDKNSPLYGMPILRAHEARTVFVLKRGKGTGFSGIENALFSEPNVRMLYGDAKETLSELLKEFK